LSRRCGGLATKLKDKYRKHLRKIFKPVTALYSMANAKVRKSIRLELVLLFGICLLASIAVGGIYENLVRNIKLNPRIEYKNSIDKIAGTAASLAGQIDSSKISISDNVKLNGIIKGNSGAGSYKILVCDLSGKVVYKNDNSNEDQVDIFDVIKNSIEINKGVNTYGADYMKGQEYITVYPVSFSDGKGYLIISGVPAGELVYDTYSKVINEFPSTVLSMITFLLLFYFITNKKMRYIETISQGLKEISKGNLDFRIEKAGDDELAVFADKINLMATELKETIEDEKRAEATKNELITNVSHDLRTPLTSIKGYLELIKSKKYKDEVQLNQFINIAYNKSEKLEVLIEDLFEYTKISNNGLSFLKQDINLNGLLEQLMEELVPICEDNNVEIHKDFSREKIMVHLDPNKTARVFENLIINAIKYSKEPKKIEIKLAAINNYARVEIQNKCEEIPEEDLKNIFDRFYKVDKSRSSNSGGSGLGLAIAKSLVELQNGTLELYYKNCTISFIVMFPLSDK
jgi:signal transduction histidine kinase